MGRKRIEGIGWEDEENERQVRRSCGGRTEMTIPFYTSPHVHVVESNRGPVASHCQKESGISKFSLNN